MATIQCSVWRRDPFRKSALAYLGVNRLHVAALNALKILSIESINLLEVGVETSVIMEVNYKGYHTTTCTAALSPTPG